MSRIFVIDMQEQLIAQTEKVISELIHKIFYTDREIWYQVGMSEHGSSWGRYIVVGPHDKFKIIIRPTSGGSSTVVDGRSYRLRIEFDEEKEAEHA